MNSPFGPPNRSGHQRRRRPLFVFRLRLSPLVLCLLPHFWFIDGSLSAVVQGALAQRSLRQNGTVPKATDKIDEEKRAKFFSRVHSIPMQTEHAMELYQHWIDQALSGLLAAVANKKLKSLPRPAQDEFGECSGAAKTVPLHARCVSRLLRSGFDGRKIYAKAYAKSHRFDRYRMQKKAAIRGSRRKVAALRGLKRLEWLRRRVPPTTKIAAEKWIGAFRTATSPARAARTLGPFGRRLLLRSYTEHRRERRHASIVKKNYYELHSPSQARLSPLGSMAKLMMEEVLRVKGKQQQDVKPWQQTIARLQKSSVRRKEIRQKLEGPDKDGDMDLDQLKFRGLKRQLGLAGEDLHAVVEDPRRARALIARTRAAARGSRASPTDRLVELLRQGFALGYSMAGQNGTDFEEKTLRSLSPRFLSVTPEGDPTRNKTIDLLSPSLFSLHADGEGIEKLTSLPSLINGFSTKDQQQWMDLIMEAAGVAEQAEHIEEELSAGGVESVLRGVRREKGMYREKYEREIRAKDGTPLYFTKKNVSDAFGKFEERKCDVFERLELGLSKEQLREMNNTGYALLSTDQLGLIYGPKSPYNNSEALRRFVRMNASDIHTGLEKDVHALAELESFRIRQKDVVLSPILFTNFILTFSVKNPVILSPILFSSLILSPNVLGPVILSPWVFVPVILSPRVLAPTILSPFLFDPIVLSPFVLHPVILSPGAFNPIVLNPFVLSPFILSPQAFTPVILSPIALSPFILNPSMGSPLILSPYVLTPSILSPQFLSAVILSPYALSPVIYSPLTAVSVILSPSWLS
uniref:MLt-TeN (Mlt-10) related n=1 Tax=Globodera rostochiensis TaxID=31243 RepID=A0A914HFA0_GLORO